MPFLSSRTRSGARAIYRQPHRTAEAAKVADTRRRAAQNGKFGQRGARQVCPPLLPLVLATVLVTFPAPVHRLCRCAASTACWPGLSRPAPPRAASLFESNGVLGVLPPHAFFSLLTCDTTAVHGEHIPWTVIILLVKSKKSMGMTEETRRCAVARQHQLLARDGKE